MASTHAKAPVGGATGHDGSPEAEYNIRGRRAGGKLHRSGEKARVEAREEALETGYISEAQVVHVEKIEAALTARVTAALKRVNAKIVAERAVEAAKRMAQLEAIEYVPFVSGIERTRAWLAAGQP